MGKRAQAVGRYHGVRLSAGAGQWVVSRESRGRRDNSRGNSGRILSAVRSNTNALETARRDIRSAGAEMRDVCRGISGHKPEAGRRAREGDNATYGGDADDDNPTSHGRGASWCAGNRQEYGAGEGGGACAQWGGRCRVGTFRARLVIWFRRLNDADTVLACAATAAVVLAMLMGWL